VRSFAVAVGGRFDGRTAGAAVGSHRSTSRRAPRVARQRSFAAKHPRITDHVPAFAEAMRAAGKRYEPTVYDDAPHAFFNDTRPSYRADAARDAWARLLGFLAAAMT
jgi:dienelactone hydrolase